MIIHNYTLPTKEGFTEDVDSENNRIYVPIIREQDTPTRIDEIEAQLMYTALMTDTLSEEEE